MARVGRKEPPYLFILYCRWRFVYWPRAAAAVWLGSYTALERKARGGFCMWL